MIMTSGSRRTPLLAKTLSSMDLMSSKDKASVLWGNHGIPHTHTLESCLVDKGRCIVSKGPFEGATGTGVVKRLFGTAPPGKVRHLRFNDLLLFWL